jgi:hypothetical protein
MQTLYTVGGFGSSRALHIDWDERTGDDLGHQVRAYLERHFGDFFMLETDDWAAVTREQTISRTLTAAFPPHTTLPSPSSHTAPPGGSSRPGRHRS